MFRNRVAQLIPVLVAFAGIGHAQSLAQQSEPMELSVGYNIRETPSSPSSAAIWTINLELQEGYLDGNNVGWLISAITISRLNATGQVADIWTEATPTVNSPDGLWWVEHADPQAPQASEFAEPPLLESTASAEDPAGSDLDYDLEGLPYNPPPEGSLFENTAAVDYRFTLVGSPEPESTGDHVLMEILPDDVPPAG